MIRCYSELIRLPTFEERYEYLKLSGVVGESTFGFDRYINQVFYRSAKWRKARDQVIIRDAGCDLAMLGYEILDRIIVHHMNPISLSDIEEEADWIFDPEYLICVSHRTHEAIHFGDANLLPKLYAPRQPGDTTLW